LQALPTLLDEGKRGLSTYASDVSQYFGEAAEAGKSGVFGASTCGQQPSFQYQYAQARMCFEKRGGGTEPYQAPTHYQGIVLQKDIFFPKTQHILYKKSDKFKAANYTKIKVISKISLIYFLDFQ
jgi:hypothetical protein